MTCRALLLLAGCVWPLLGQTYGTWTATGAGQTLSGAWTAQPHTEPNTMWGKWSLRDPYGREMAGGSWSARKVAKAWRGSFQAQVVGGSAVSGNWTARVGKGADASFTELFESAMKAAVSGSWHRGRRAGAWSIRAYAGR